MEKSNWKSLSEIHTQYGLHPTTVKYQVTKGVVEGKKEKGKWSINMDSDYFRKRSAKQTAPKKKKKPIFQVSLDTDLGTNVQTKQKSDFVPVVFVSQENIATFIKSWIAQ